MKGSVTGWEPLVSVDLLSLLQCPSCRGALAEDRRPPDAPALVCGGCGLRAPVVGGIPRFVSTPEGELARKTQASFGYEWSHFDDWRSSGETNFQDYFQGIDLAGASTAVVLDAGCGMGRHARQIAPHVARVVAVDFSRAIEQAFRNTAELSNVDCVQADLLALPVKDESFDLVYSLGVLHHLADTKRALALLARKLRPGGKLRVYLYWKRRGWSGALLKLVSIIRAVTTRMPFPLLRAFCWLLSVKLTAFVVWPYRALSALGVRGHEGWPLFVYTKYPFRVLYNDQFDRFSAPLEQRFDDGEVRALLQGAGLVDVRVRACYGWLGDGTKPGGGPATGLPPPT